jgi:very-short-patch-repair endonuclease
VVKVKRKTYFLDFAIYCVNGKIDVETDGDTWHADKKRIPADNERDNDLQTVGWRTLRFNTHHLQEKMVEYCIPAIAENINKLGGLESGKLVAPEIKPEPPQWQQLSLF